MLKKVVFCIFFQISLYSLALGQLSKSQWVDSVFQTLKTEEKIGQLMMVPVSPTDQEAVDRIKTLVKSHDIGGVIVTDGGPVSTATLINQLQNRTKVPLLTGIDAEWGLGKTLDSTMLFPKAFILGSITNDGLIYEMGSEIGRQMKAIGLNLNFAPMATLSRSVSADTIYRSFGNDKINVAEKSIAYMRGLQSANVLACAKSFPVKGITVQGMEKGFPILKHQMDSTEVYPYQQLFNNNITGVIPATVDFPLFYENIKVIKQNPYSTSTLTSLFTGDWIKKQLKYQGLIFANVPDMQETTQKYREGEAELFAFQAGNDVLMFPEDVGSAIKKIKREVNRNKDLKNQLDVSVKKILAAKYDAGLATIEGAETDNLVQILNQPEAIVLRQQLMTNAITLLKNDHHVLPIKSLEDKTFATLSIGRESINEFSRYVSRYVGSTSLAIRLVGDTLLVKKDLQNKDVVVVGLFPMAQQWQQQLIPFLNELQKKSEVIICSFGSAESIAVFDKFPTLVLGHSGDFSIPKAVPQILFGAIEAAGKLPITISSSLKIGAGIKTTKLDRLAYSIPEDVGVDSRVLTKIKDIAYEAIHTRATPGCYVLVAKNGKVIYERAFGWQTYENKIPVNDETLYDLASVTKTLATLQSIMFLADRNQINVNKKVSFYLPELKESNKKDFTLKDILTHQAGLWPYLPFWTQTLEDSVFMPEYYSPVKNEKYPWEVAENLYASKAMKDSLWHWIIDAKIREKPNRTPYDYRYSDMGFYILQHLAEKKFNQPMQDFLDQNLYEPIGANHTGYLPLKKFSKNQIAPTEYDTLFRKSLLTGYVHDQGAAMHGGIAGHAGLFGTANDMAKIGQMLLQNGKYGGYQYYKPETVAMFTQKQYESSRRGLGWDKPVQSTWASPTSIYASPKTFGHTGFTGTCIWVDPEFDLVYIFLSNRVHPDMNNSKLISQNIRSRIQDTIYQAIFSYSQYGATDNCN